MSDKGVDAPQITITIDSTDWHLGIANLLMALHHDGQINLAAALPEFDRLNAKNFYRPKETGEKKHSAAGRQLASILRKLEPSFPGPTES